MHRKMRYLLAVVVVFLHLGTTEVIGYNITYIIQRASSGPDGDRLLYVGITMNTETGDPEVRSVEIANSLDTVTIESCIFTQSSSYLVLIDGTTSPSQIRNSPTSPDIGCTFEDNENGNYKFIVRVRGSLTEMLTTDRDFEVVITNDGEGTFELIGGTPSYPDLLIDQPISQTVVVLTAVHQEITTTLSVVGASSTVVTSLSLGEQFKLMLTTTIDPFREGGIEGVRITSCVVASNDLFNAPITIIGANGCFVDNKIFSNVETTVGFSKDDDSSTANTQNATKDYVAISPFLEVGSPTSGAASDGTNNLYFRCSIEYCKDDQDGGPGCGGNHCDSSRKKRNAIRKKKTIATASVSLKAAKTKEKCQSCSETMLYKVVIGGGATAAAILFGLMMYLFFDLEHKIKVATIKKRAQMEENSRKPSMRQQSLTSDKIN